MRANTIGVTSGAIIAAAIVLTSMVFTHPGWGFFSHTECTVRQDLGNVTAWVPNAVVAAPYLGYESGTVGVWSSYPDGAYLQLTINTNVSDGNVTAFIVGYENWTIFSVGNTTSPGAGPESPCRTPAVAYGSLTPVADLRHGGTFDWPIAARMVTDVGLPLGLNGSQLCREIQNTSDSECGVGAEFNVNFERATGLVNTCGSRTATVLPFESRSWPVTVPFRTGGRTLTVPLDPLGPNPSTYSNGTFAWYNYTFPANTGVWQYDDLSQTSETGAGLVFSYAPCS
jgi:hypothetical protein